MPFFFYILTTFSISFTNVNSQSHSDNEEYVTVYEYCDPTPDSNIHINNGLYYIKPSATGPVIPTICSNGYNMIDVSFDLNLNSIPSYLSSWDYARMDINHIITNLDDTSTFREWWLPSSNDTHFRVAPSCKSCDPNTNRNLNENTVYYTEGSLFAYTYYLGNPCLDNISQYGCNKCDVGIFIDDDIDSPYQYTKYWSTCSALQVPSDTPSLHEPDLRVNHHLIYRPVMSLKRDACTCYQQSTNKKPNKYVVKYNELPKITVLKQTNDVRDYIDHIDNNIKFDIRGYDDGGFPFEPIFNDKLVNDKANLKSIDCSSNIIYLTQNDFISGTYRIRECGEYIFTENIQCNFNSPTASEENNINFSPNSINGNRLYWYPTEKQSINDYPGLYTFQGSYSLGFFAGITIEHDNVTINLNGFSFSMDRRFYLQQRFFSLIEMASKPFLPHQGASTWGLHDVYYSKNLIIHGPGNIGLSSHHGIHGNLVSNVEIYNLNIHNFDVAGLGCNGCRNVYINNIITGPQNNNIPTLGRYTHARAFIPRLKYLKDYYGDKKIKFYGRSVTNVSDLCQKMVNQMDMIYNNYINNIKYDDINNNEWIAAKKVFQNPTGWMDGGTSYGISINGGGAAVVGIGTRVSGVENINMDNVEIFGVYNQAIEKIKFGDSEGTTRGILFDVTDWISIVDQIDDRYTTQYIGDVYSDIQFAANKYIKSWYYRNSLFISSLEEEFVFNGNLAPNNYPFTQILVDIDDDDVVGDYWNGCGTDIQLHSSKGSIGLMVNGAQSSSFNNIYIHDIYNWANLGSNVCGPYPYPHLTTEDIDIQYGYTGTRSHGMIIDYTSGDYTNIRIENIESYNGEANGLTIYKQSYINIQNIEISNLNAGTQLTINDINNLPILPNLVPRACPIDIHDPTNNININFIDNNYYDNIKFNKINGYQKCDVFNDLKNINTDIDDTQSNIILLILVIFLIMFMFLLITVLLCVFITKYVQINNQKNKKQAYVSSIITEKTPLLPSI